ncbi:MAG TPA: alpha/beta hydrolase [Balneolales bacterium]|nr:alpha/beta hydrolase [Balneolales bacterium]
MLKRFAGDILNKLIIVASLLFSLFLTQCRDFTALYQSGHNNNPLEKTAVLATHYYSVPNGAWKDVIIYAHGYVDPTTPPPTIPDDQIDGRYIGDIINSLGYAFATTSYPDNGLVVRDAIPDVKKLADEFKAQFPQTERIFLIGVSEGGLITTKVIEDYPETFTGGIAGCGPIGNFEKQLDYFGNFQVLFHYFYPQIGLLNLGIGSPEHVPDTLIALWQDGTIKHEVETRIIDVSVPLLKTADAPLSNPDDTRETLLGILRYNLLATNDAIQKLGGEPFDNSKIFYHGTGSGESDLLLNQHIPRFRADSTAIRNIDQYYQTTGKLQIPLVTIHNTGDPIVPYFHEPLYEQKIVRQGSSSLHVNIPVNSYGHCNFTTADLLGAFSALINMTSNKQLVVNQNIFPESKQVQEFLQIANRTGAHPTIIPPDQSTKRELTTYKHGYLSH